VQYSHDAAAKRVIGHTLVLVPGSLPGRLALTPVFDNGEDAASPDDVDNHGDNNCDEDNDDVDNDKDGDDEGEKKPSGRGVKLMPRGELRHDHRGMASVTTIIGGDRKRKATGDPV
jgi:hypothetical protein